MASSHRLMPSPLGELLLVASREGLTHLFFPGEPVDPLVGDGSPEAVAVIAEAQRQLEDWFSGRRRDFDLPLAPAGTPFRVEVWQVLRQIPWGETLSYGELARRVGRPGASRAVGGAWRRGRNVVAGGVGLGTVAGVRHRPVANRKAAAGITRV